MESPKIVIEGNAKKIPVDQVRVSRFIALFIEGGSWGRVGVEGGWALLEGGSSGRDGAGVGWELRQGGN